MKGRKSFLKNPVFLIGVSAGVLAVGAAAWIGGWELFKTTTTRYLIGLVSAVGINFMAFFILRKKKVH